MRKAVVCDHRFFIACDNGAEEKVTLFIESQLLRY